MVRTILLIWFVLFLKLGLRYASPAPNLVTAENGLELLILRPPLRMCWHFRWAIAPSFMQCQRANVWQLYQLSRIAIPVLLLM